MNETFISVYNRTTVCLIDITKLNNLNLLTKFAVEGDQIYTLEYIGYKDYIFIDGWTSNMIIL